MKNKRVSLFYSLPQVLVDLVVVFLSYFVAFLLRFDGLKYETVWENGILLSTRGVPPYYWVSYLELMPWCAVVCVLTFTIAKFYNTM